MTTYAQLAAILMSNKVLSLYDSYDKSSSDRVSGNHSLDVSLSKTSINSRIQNSRRGVIQNSRRGVVKYDFSMKIRKKF